MGNCAILRYELRSLQPYTAVELPIGAEVVDAVWQEARQAFSIYALVKESNLQTELRYFGIYSTGGKIAKPVRHIRSVIMPDGYHVFHVVEISL